MKTMKIIYISFLVLIICLQTVLVVAQKSIESIELTVTQPSTHLNIRLLYDPFYMITGQQYAIIVQNLSNKNMHVKGQLVAVLVCGNEVSTKFDEVLKPFQKKGGDTDDGTGMSDKVKKEDCQNPEIVHDKYGFEAQNRIRTLELRSYSAIIEKTDEEKAAEEKQKQDLIDRKKQEETNRQAAATQQIATQQQQQRQQQENQRQQIAAGELKQRQGQAEIQRVQDQIASREKMNSEIHNAVTEGLKTFTDALKEKQQREQAQRDRQDASDQAARLKKENETAEREQKRAAAKLISDEEERVERQEQREQQARNNENIMMWARKKNEILDGYLAAKAIIKKPSEINDTKVQSVYYAVWNFSKTPNQAAQILVAAPVEIKKDGDGEWPLNKDLLPKIEKQAGLLINYTPDLIATGENALGYLLGYFTTLQEAQKAVDDIKSNAIENGYTIVTIAKKTEVEETPEQKQKRLTDFWNEDKPTEKKKTTEQKPKNTTDFWKE